MTSCRDLIGQSESNHKIPRISGSLQQKICVVFGRPEKCATRGARRVVASNLR